MIRKLLATTAIATLVASGAYAQSSDTSGQQPAQATQPAQSGDAAAGAAPADGQSGDAATSGAAAQSDTQQPADATAQDSSQQPADATAQDSTQQPADATAQSGTDAAGQSSDMAADAGMQDVEGHLASNLIGMRVYNGTNDDAENIGEVNDIVIGKDGKAELVVIGVGGFLGIGEKKVALEYADLEWAERDGDMWLVAQGQTKEQLEAAPEFDTAAYDPTENDAAEGDVAADQSGTTSPATGGTAATGGVAATTPPASGDAASGTASTEQPADDSMAAAEQPAGDDAAATSGQAAGSSDMAATDQPADGAASTEQPAQDTAAAEQPADDATAAQGTDQTTTAAVDRSQLKDWDTSSVSAEELIGTTVYGANDEQIGEIGDVVLSTEGSQGQVDAIVVDVGGFLGMGEKPVAIGMDNLKFMQDDDGNRYLYTNLTKEQLEGQQAYDEGSYAQNRDQQRMTVQ